MLCGNGLSSRGHFPLLFSGFCGDLFAMLRLSKPPSPALLLSPTLSLYIYVRVAKTTF